ncbi:MAG: hypothetical protein EXS15_07925 [Phycisphaerales bacterium]|nr:hypothetical protein [Phycisphaerales bacterium]
MERPLGLAAIASRTADSFAALAMDPTRSGRRAPARAAAEFVCASFGSSTAGLVEYQGTLPIPSAQGAIFAMDFLLNEPRLTLTASLADRPTAEQCFEFLNVFRSEVSLSKATVQRFAAFSAQSRRSMDMSEAGLMRAVSQSLAHIDADLGVTADWKALEAEPTPAELVDHLTGSILAAENVPGIGWIVVGSPADNTYDMSIIAAVFDPAGAETYRWSSLRSGNQGIIDLTGNDQYIGGDQQGPAAGLFGLSFIDDAAGDDQYTGEHFACGAGMFGVGILIDRNGNDVYRTGSWSLGAGILGAGFVFDLAGGDEYQSMVYSQGIGGPLGVGALVDCSGNDFYRVDGVAPSVDQVPTVRYAMSQGIGFGARGLIAGGVGIISDLDGHDRYESGEFSQGGGYYFGIGLILDSAGHDLYRASHYAQGFSAHQAAGVLIDVSGDDQYWSMISAAQGAAWDTSASLLLDGSGDDTYRGDALSQGAAAQQAVAAICDLDGSDHYVGLGPFVQGESGDNTYHFADTNARSLSVLIDSGAGDDFFSARRIIGGVTLTSPLPTLELPANAPSFGIAIDCKAKRSTHSKR